MYICTCCDPFIICVKKLTGFEFDINSLIENTNPGAIFFLFINININICIRVTFRIYLLKIILEGINGNNPKWDNSPRLRY